MKAGSCVFAVGSFLPVFSILLWLSPGFLRDRQVNLEVNERKLVNCSRKRAEKGCVLWRKLEIASVCNRLHHATGCIHKQTQSLLQGVTSVTTSTTSTPIYIDKTTTGKHSRQIPWDGCHNLTSIPQMLQPSLHLRERHRSRQALDIISTQKLYATAVTWISYQTGAVLYCISYNIGQNCLSESVQM